MKRNHSQVWVHAFNKQQVFPILQFTCQLGRSFFSFHANTHLTLPLPFTFAIESKSQLQFSI